MKLLITPLIDRLQPGRQTNYPESLEHLIGILKSASSRIPGQAIELQGNPPVRNQIETALDNIDITNLLDPLLPNTGGMEVLATLKRELTLEIEAICFERDH